MRHPPTLEGVPTELSASYDDRVLGNVDLVLVRGSHQTLEFLIKVGHRGFCIGCLEATHEMQLLRLQRGQLYSSGLERVWVHQIWKEMRKFSDGIFDEYLILITFDLVLPDQFYVLDHSRFDHSELVSDVRIHFTENLGLI